MTVVTLRPGQLGARMAQDRREREARLAEAQFEAAKAGADFLRPLLPKDRGPLRESCQAHRTQDGAELRIDAPYAGTIEAGMRPGVWVPLEPLVGWVERHPQYFAAATPGEAEHIARMIQRAIHAEGQPPRWIVRGHLDDLRALLARVIDQKLNLPAGSTTVTSR